MSQANEMSNGVVKAGGRSADLAGYLSVRDQPCPHCGTNLRGQRGPACPQCGLTLTVSLLQAARGPKASVPVIAVRWLSLLAFAIAGYLAVTSLTNHQPAGCSPGAGCGNVLSSAWASLWGLPVSVPGAVTYFTIFLLTFHLSPTRPDAHRRNAWLILTGLSVCAGLAAVWFIYLQFVHIKSVCPYCMIDHVCGLLIAGLVLYTAPLGRGETLADGRRSTMSIAPGQGAGVIAAGGLAIGLFIAAQVMFPASTHQIVIAPGGDPLKDGGKAITITDDPAKKDAVTKDSALKDVPTKDQLTKDAVTKDDVAKDGAAKDVAHKDGPAKDGTKPSTPSSKDGTVTPPPDASLFVRLPRAKTEGGLVRFPRNGLPVRGDPNAKALLVCMVDYTCPHCRELHHLFDKAWERYGDQIAFMLVPMPLNPDCNPYIDFRDPRHAAACDLARLSLAVWKADASKFEAFDNWLFEPKEARTGHEARLKAEELVGKAELKAVFDTGWPHEQALRHVRLYEMAGLGRIPKILYSNVRIEGTIQASDLWQWLESSDGPGLSPKGK